jgi:hypothetical protein
MSRQPTSQELEAALQEARDLLTAGRPHEALAAALKALHQALGALQSSLLALQANLIRVQQGLARLAGGIAPPAPPAGEPDSGYQH